MRARGCRALPMATTSETAGMANAMLHAVTGTTKGARRAAQPPLLPPLLFLTDCMPTGECVWGVPPAAAVRSALACRHAPPLQLRALTCELSPARVPALSPLPRPYAQLAAPPAGE